MTEHLTPHGALLNQARIVRGLSQRGAAKKAEISEGRWRQIVTGKQRAGGLDIPVNPKPSTLAAMARAVGADVEAVFRAAGLDGESSAYQETETTGLIAEANRDEAGDWHVVATSTAGLSRLEVHYWPGAGRAVRSLTEIADLAYDGHLTAMRFTITDEGGDGDADNTGRSAPTRLPASGPVSVVPDIVDDVAADQDEDSDLATGEQEESDTP